MRITFIRHTMGDMRRGTTMVLSVLMLWMLLTIATGVATVLIGEIKISGDAEGSLVALYAADTGVECTLYEKRIGGVTCTDGVGVPMCDKSRHGLTLDACYTKVLDVKSGSEVTLQFTGTFRETNRGLEVRYEE